MISPTRVMPRELIEEIFRSQQVADEHGNLHKLHSAISPAEGDFIYSLVLHHKAERSIEIGCGYGISSLYICSALSRKGSRRHLIIDPYQFPDWHGIGVNNLKRAGFTFFELIEKPSEIALPELLRAQQKYDFAFIDGWHTFDHALLDFFYLDRMLESGGVVVFDDIDYPALKKLVRYISHYENYEIADSLQYARTLRTRIGDKLSAGFSRILRRLPAKCLRKVFSDEVIRPDSVLGLNTSMIAMRKTAEDLRNWDWYEAF